MLDVALLVRVVEGLVHVGGLLVGVRPVAVRVKALSALRHHDYMMRT